MRPFAILLMATLVVLVSGYCALAPDLAELQNDVQAYQRKQLLPEEE